ncbi:MAG TPA: winged helix-turn-helix domain-containing protein [Vicinamibacterales bacterium]|nr:winged helix-turn-helix domain-containing protein [Vicinamibacterales bacterium]
MEIPPKKLPIFSFGPFLLDLTEHALLRDGRPVPLTPKVFEVLRLLVQNAGHLVLKEQLLKEVWPDTFVEEANLNRAVSVLRKALGESQSDRYIETVPKRGYRFVAHVTEGFGVSSLVESTPAKGAPRVRALAGPPRVRALAGPLRMAGVASALLASVAVAYVARGSHEAAPPLSRGPVHRQVTFTGTEGGAPALSPDGRSIAYVSFGSRVHTLMVKDTTGGQPVPVDSAPEIARPRPSPDGSRLLYWKRGAGIPGMYVVPRTGGTSRLVAPGLFVACWSPDGSTIAAAQFLQGKILFVSTSGDGPRSVALESTSSWIYDIDWSPATNHLLFSSSDGRGGFSIWTMQPDGSEQTKVLADRVEIAAVRWAPDARSIYYFRRVNQTMSLHKLARQSRDATWEALPGPLLTGLETDGSFGLSVDGRSLVYSRAPFLTNLWTVQTGDEGTGDSVVTRQLTSGTSFIERPRISPDGKRVAFNVGYESHANLHVMSIEGGPSTQLTFLDGMNVGPAWSPDGEQIAFASTEGITPRVWVVGARGGAPRAVSSSDLSGEGLEVSWGPGSQLLYQQTGNRNFSVLDLGTGHERPLIKDSSVGWAFSPVHSPDGRRIAVAWNRRPARGIWIIDTRDSSERLLYAAPPPLLLAWSADGTSIYALEGGSPVYRGLIAHRGESLTDARIVKVSALDGHVQSTVTLPFEEVGGVSVSPDGRTFVCTVYSSRSDIWVVDDFDITKQP